MTNNNEMPDEIYVSNGHTRAVSETPHPEHWEQAKYIQADKTPIVSDDVKEALERVLSYASSHVGSFETMEAYKEFEQDKITLRYASLTHAPATSPDDGWKTIDNAPRDGSKIWVYTVNGDNLECRWDEATCDASDDMGHDAGWISPCGGILWGRSFGNPDYYREPNNPPTHWMLLPKPPTISGDE